VVDVSEWLEGEFEQAAREAERLYNGFLRWNLGTILRDYPMF
jgi:hypothetical protein